MMPNKIQSKEYSMDGGMGGILRTLVNPNGNRYVLCLYRNDDDRWNWNANWLDNGWNDRNFSARLATLFISLRSIFFFGWRVLFCKLSVPATKHFAGLIQLYGKSDVFFIVDRFCFPKYQEKYAESVRFLDR